MTAATVKTGLMYSPLTSKVYWGKMNTNTGVSIGNTQKDVTSDFIGIMLQKFPINTSQNVTSNGQLECVVMVLDDKKCHKYMAACDLNDALEALVLFTKPTKFNAVALDNAHQALAKARGE